MGYRQSDEIGFSDSSLGQSFKGLTRGQAAGVSSNFVLLGPVFSCGSKKFIRPKSFQLVQVDHHMLDSDCSQTPLFPWLFCLLNSSTGSTVTPELLYF